jgi:hypothetical protein
MGLITIGAADIRPITRIRPGRGGRLNFLSAGAMDRLYDVLAIWWERGVAVTGKGMPGGHNMQEGAPAEVLAELRAVLRA